MTETPAAPSKLANVVSKGVSLAETGVKKVVGFIAPPVMAVIHAAATVTGLKLAWSTLVLLCRNPSSWLIIVPVLVGVYVIGHHEEANKAKAVFTQLSSCVTSLGQAKAELARPAKVAACPAVAPAPVVAPAAPASQPARAPAHHKKRPVSQGFFGSL